MVMLFKPYETGKLWIYGHCVMYSLELDKLYLWTYHRRGKFITQWKVDRLKRTAANVTPLNELSKPKVAGRIPRVAMKVHYGAIKQLGLIPVNVNGAKLEVAKCKFNGRCAFKTREEGRAYCTWPYTCNQKLPLTP